MSDTKTEILQICAKCGHLAMEHGQECQFVDSDSRHEVCLLCDGYEEPGYPNGQAWHRFVKGAETP